MADATPSIQNYSTIQDSYDGFVNRSIEQSKPYEIPPVIPDGGTVKDMWINSFIRSINWTPVQTGFNIDGLSGIAEFQKINTKEIRLRTNDSGGLNGGIFNYYQSTVLSMRLLPDGRIFFIPPASVQEGIIDINKVSSGGEMYTGGGFINISALIGNYSKKGIFMDLDGNSSANPTVGIQMYLNDGSSGSGAAAFNFIYRNGANAAIIPAVVGGSQDKKIRILINGTFYYIPCHTA